MDRINLEDVLCRGVTNSAPSLKNIPSLSYHTNSQAMREQTSIIIRANSRGGEGGISPPAGYSQRMPVPAEETLAAHFFSGQGAYPCDSLRLEQLPRRPDRRH